jgi:hypothetical protein
MIAGLAAFGCPASRLAAESVADIGWGDLVPEGQQQAAAPTLEGLVLHEQAALAALQPRHAGVRTDWDGRAVRLSGYTIPLEFQGAGVTVFMLVPYVGACIHVPPPPANQLVLVTTERPYAMDGLFSPVTVTGTMEIASMSTELAEVGYALVADDVVAYRGE